MRKTSFSSVEIIHIDSEMNPSVLKESTPQKKGGRPPLPPAERQEKAITIRLTTTRHAQLLQQAQQDKCPLAEVIRRLVEVTPTPVTTRHSYTVIRELDTMSTVLQDLAARAEREGVYQVVWDLQECSRQVLTVLEKLRQV